LVIKDFIINLFIIVMTIIPTFTYRSQEQKGGQVILTLTFSVALVLCMSFPFTVFPGHMYDLRLIPLLIGILYGGWKTGGFLALVLFGYRYWLGDDGFYTTLFSYPWGIALAMYLSPRFRQSNRHRRQKIVIGLTLLLTSFITVVSLVRFDQYSPRVLEFFLIYMCMNVLAAWLSHYLIEMIQENKAMRMEMQHAEKMHLIGELAASIAHEIRNPMTVARGFIQLLSQQEKDEQRSSYMQIVIQELDRAEAIINDYLSFTKPQFEQRETVDVANLVQQVTGVISSYAILKGVIIRTYLQDCIWVNGNRQKLTQVLLNLMKNGIEAMLNGGTLQILAIREEPYVKIDVIDSGIGMGKKELGRLGTPFYSTKEKGTGLGLMISYQIVESMGGKIRVESEKGKGTQFTLLLPAAMPEATEKKKVV
jgi:two-component system, sporulation sensor kinase B